MTWFKENKFVAGVLVVTVLGAGALGWLLFGAKGKYDESASAFDKQAAELNRLETAPAYPDDQNLEVLKDQKVKHLAVIADLQKSLVAAEFTADPVSPTSFQDQLRAAVTQLTGRPGVPGLPKGFYYGFEPYLTTPPNPEAAPVLGRELKAIQLIFQILLDSGKGRVQSVSYFSREPLPEEAVKKAEPPKPAAPKKPGEKQAPVVEPLVKPHYVDLVFVAEQRAVADVLNALASNKQQFYITRYIALHNTKETPPPRDAVSAVAVVDPNAPATPPGPGSLDVAVKDPIILGKEKLEVTVRVEIVDFAPPKAEATPAPKPTRNAGK
jgi:hypothetical protein